MLCVLSTMFQVVIFLIGCPVIILLGFFLFVINCYYTHLRDLNQKEASSKAYAKNNNGNPSSFSRRVSMIIMFDIFNPLNRKYIVSK